MEATMLLMLGINMFLIIFFGIRNRVYAPAIKTIVADKALLPADVKQQLTLMLNKIREAEDVSSLHPHEVINRVREAIKEL